MNRFFFFFFAEICRPEESRTIYSECGKEGGGKPYKNILLGRVVNHNKEAKQANKQKLKEFIIRPALQEMIKGLM